MNVTIRAATHADLSEAYAIQRDASLDAGMEIGIVFGEHTGAVPAKFLHECDHGRFLVAEHEGEMLGFGALFERAAVSFLATLFVRPTAQAAGLRVGKRLLDALFVNPEHTRCVVSSHVHRAISAYVRHGMLPRWPLYMLAASSDRLEVCSPPDVEAIRCEVTDAGLLEWDAEIAGRGIRAIDQRYWLEARGATPYWLVRGGERIGYGYIQDLERSADAPWSPDTAFVGPVGVRDPADARAAVIALTGVARSVAGTVRLDIPGSHGAFPALLDAGFQIFYQTMFCSSTDAGPFDPGRYLPADTITF